MTDGCRVFLSESYIGLMLFEFEYQQEKGKA